MKSQHFSDDTGLAEGIEEVFGIIAVINPLVRSGADNGIDRNLRCVLLGEVEINAVYGLLQIAR